MEPLIIFDSKKCIHCHSCEVACQLENHASPGLRLRYLRSHETGVYPSAREQSISRACFHCNDPSCVSACPSGALRRRPDGVVAHDISKCIGCGYCIHACPFHVPLFNPEQSVMRKCGFCTQRIDRGRKPACVAKCATGSLTYFPDGSLVGPNATYGRNEKLHMVYQLDGPAKDFGLPDPVPMNTVASSQLWNWLAGLLPGGLLLAWLWKQINQEDEGHGNDGHGDAGHE
jgi:anaerobic dimethyl sulfoxide reductase subunit B (iron-sulfur subunit)